MNCTIESTRPHLEPGEEVYAIDYILIGGVRRTLAVCAFSGDEAFLMCRDNLRKRGLMSAALQGSPRIATTGDIARSEPHDSHHGLGVAPDRDRSGAPIDRGEPTTMTDKMTCCQVCGDGVPLDGAPPDATWIVCEDCLADGYTDAPGQDVLRAVSPPVERRQVMTGRIDRDSIRLVIDAVYEHSYAYEWQGEVVSRG